MRNVGTYLKSWFGRFDAVTYRRPDPWLWLPAAVLLLLGLLMVLNTTYFLGIEKRGDAFHFFKLHLAHIAVGFVFLMLLSQFSLAGLRRIAMPLFVASIVMLALLYVPGLGVDERRRAPMAAARPGDRGAVGAGEIRAGVFPREVSEPAAGADPRVHSMVRCSRISDRRADHAVNPEAAGLRQHRDDRADPVRDAVRGRRALGASGGRGRRRAGAAGVPGGGEIVPHEAADDFPRSVVSRARRRLPAHPIVHRARRGRQMGRRPRRRTPENVLSAARRTPISCSRWSARSSA